METLDFFILAKTKVTHEEFGALCGVTRSAVNHWVKGRNSVNKFNRARVSKRLLQLKAALDKGLLPTPAGASLETHIAALQEVLKLKV
jgi:hypothetical protein